MGSRAAPHTSTPVRAVVTWSSGEVWMNPCSLSPTPRRRANAGSAPPGLSPTDKTAMSKGSSRGRPWASVKRTSTPPWGWGVTAVTRERTRPTP